MKKPLRTFKEARARKAGGRKREKRKGKEGKSSRVSEMRMRRHCRRKLKLL